MVVQVGSVGQLHHSPADTLAPWRCCDRISSLNDDGDDDTGICCDDAQMVHGLELTRLRLHTPSSGSPSRPRPEESKSAPTSPTSSEPSHTSSLSRSQQSPTSLKLRPVSPDQKSPLPSPTPTPSPLPLSQLGQKLSQKRRRPLTDVDGPDTASLGCKKRRLRLHLITSRLSRPFSVPATHILNREAIANYPGEGRRFAKLAKYLVARRAAVSVLAPASAHNPSSVDLLRRAAIHNRLIIRMRSNGQMLYAQQQITGGVGMAAVAHHGMALMSAAKFFFPSTAPSAPAQPPPPPQHQNHTSMQQWHHHHTPDHVHAAPGPASVTQHYGAMLPITPPPAAETPAPPIRRRGLEYNHARLPPSPKPTAVGSPGNSRRRASSPSPLSRSPEFRPARERDFDDDDEVDDDAVSFPTNEIESSFGDSDDEADGDGYDFGVIFGGSGPGGNNALTPDELDELEFGMLDDQPAERGEHFYEEYLEELDGIPWRA